MCDLDNWPRNLLNNFVLKNFLHGATYVTKDIDRGKYVYSGYGVVFDGAGSWSFGNAFAQNAVIFGVDNSLSSHSNNRMNMF